MERKTSEKFFGSSKPTVESWIEILAKVCRNWNLDENGCFSKALPINGLVNRKGINDKDGRI